MSDESSRCGDVARLLNVPLGESEPALRELYTAAAGSIPDALLDRTARALSSSFDPLLVERALYGEISPVRALPVQDAKFSTARQRSDATRSVWQRGSKLEAADPARAREHALAALLLATVDPFFGSPKLFNDIVTDPGLRRRAGLNDQQLKQLMDLGQAWSAASADFVRAQLQVVPILDGLIKREGPATAQEVDEFLKPLRACWPKIEGDLRSQFRACRLMWLFKCRAKGRNDKAAVDRVVAELEALRAETRSPLVGRWLTDAISQDGPYPRGTGVRIVKDPDDLKPPPP